MKRKSPQPYTFASEMIRHFLDTYGVSISYLEKHGISHASILAFRRGEITSTHTFFRILALSRRLALADGDRNTRRRFNRDLLRLMEHLIEGAFR